MAAVCRRVWGLIRLSFSDGQVSAAIATYFRTMRSIPSRLKYPCRLLTNNASCGAPALSRSHCDNACTLSLRSGVARSLRPLPQHRTYAWDGGSRFTSQTSRPISSDTRRPVCRATSNRVRSRLPIHVEGSGAARRRADSAGSRKSIIRLS